MKELFGENVPELEAQSFGITRDISGKFLKSVLHLFFMSTCRIAEGNFSSDGNIIKKLKSDFCRFKH